MCQRKGCLGLRLGDHTDQLRALARPEPERDNQPPEREARDRAIEATAERAVPTGEMIQRGVAGQLLAVRYRGREMEPTVCAPVPHYADTACWSTWKATATTRAL